MLSLRRNLWLTLLAPLLLSPAARANDGLLETFEGYLPAAKAYQAGDDTSPLVEIEKIVFALPPSSGFREPIEQKLIATLDAAETLAAKQFLCRQLRVVGTSRCIASLSKLLVDADTCSMAIYALERLESPQVDEALLSALPQAPGSQQAGIIHALARRRCQDAKPELLKLLSSGDPVVVAAAAHAAGTLGGSDTVEALKTIRAQATAELAVEIDHGLLEAADRFLADGDQQQAADTLDFVRTQQPARQFQLAALRGLLRARPEDAAATLVAAISQPDSTIVQDAIALTATAPGEAVTIACAKLLDTLSPENQVLLLGALAARGDRAASPQIIAAARSSDESVRSAAIEALGEAGHVDAAIVLLRTAAEEGNVASIARRSLLLLQGDGVEVQLLLHMTDAQESIAVQAIHAVAGRRMSAALPPLFQLAQHRQSSVRQEALRALAALGGPADCAKMIPLAANFTSSDDQEVYLTVMTHMLEKNSGNQDLVASLLAALNSESQSTTPVLLRLLGRTGAPEALAAIRAHRKFTSPAVHNAVIQALADWPDANAREDLLDVIQTTSNPTYKKLALQGYLRMAGLTDNPTELIAGLLQQVQRPSDKKLALTELGLQADTLPALELAVNYLADPELAPTAGLATLRIANRLRDSEPQRARSALNQVIQQVDHADVRQRAQEVVLELQKYDGHILEWVAAGPYVEKAKDGAAIYEIAFPPEQSEAQDVKWEKVTKGVGSWSINLDELYSGRNHCAAYLRTGVWSPTDQEAQLEMGSDDAVKAWLNDELVFSRWSEQGCAPRQHLARVRLREGWNVLLLKAVDFEGGWEVGCRLRSPNGEELDGLKYSAE